MDKRAFAKALRAAAKITFGTSLLGCGVTIDSEGLDTEESEETRAVEEDDADVELSLADEARRRVAELGHPDPITPVCEGPAGELEDWSVYDEQTFACCAEALSASLPATFEREGFGVQPEPQIDNCCVQLLSENYSAIWSGEPLPHPAPDDVITACCVTRHGNAACTPWGPPVPPAMEPGDFVPWLLAGASQLDAEARSGGAEELLVSHVQAVLA